MKRLLTMLVLCLGVYWLYNKFTSGVSKVQKNVSQEMWDDTSNTNSPPSTPPSSNDQLLTVEPSPTVGGTTTAQPIGGDATQAYKPSEQDLKAYEQPQDVLPEPPQAKFSDLPGNTLVSCQTKVKYCEPSNGNYNPDEAENGTFCIAYLNNCDSTDSVQRTWTEDEVFGKPNAQPEPPPEIDPSTYDQQYPQQYPQENPIQDNYNPNIQNPEYVPEEIPGQYPQEGFYKQMPDANRYPSEIGTSN